jgi:hypothetical protein
VPRGGRLVTSPFTNRHEGPAPEQQPVGGYEIEVNCNYFTKTGRHIEVGVGYDLPIDPNPYNDFDVGCAATNAARASGPSGTQAWDPTLRVYRIVSLTRWADAVFSDFQNQLRPGEVPSFEAVTRQLMRNAEPYAHACKVVTSPTRVSEIWQFSFDATVVDRGVVTTTTGTSGSFVAKPDANGRTRTLTRLTASDIVVKVGGQGSVTLRVGRGLSFDLIHGAGTLRAVVTVARSSYAGCHAGLAGLLRLKAANQTAALDVCGRNLLAGRGQITDIFTTIG